MISAAVNFKSSFALRDRRRSYVSRSSSFVLVARYGNRPFPPPPLHSPSQKTKFPFRSLTDGDGREPRKETPPPPLPDTSSPTPSAKRPRTRGPGGRQRELYYARRAMEIENDEGGDWQGRRGVPRRGVERQRRPPYIRGTRGIITARERRFASRRSFFRTSNSQLETNLNAR